MADHIFPIVSTTPPPLDFDDDEDDFTDFSAAQNHWAVEPSDDFTDCPLPEVKRSPQDSPVKSSSIKTDLFKPIQQNDTPDSNMDQFPLDERKSDGGSSGINGINEVAPDISFNDNILNNHEEFNSSFQQHSVFDSVVVPESNRLPVTTEDLEYNKPHMLAMNEGSLKSDSSQNSSNSDYEESQSSFTEPNPVTEVATEPDKKPQNHEDHFPPAFDHNRTSESNMSDKFYSANDLVEVAAAADKKSQKETTETEDANMPQTTVPDDSTPPPSPVSEDGFPPQAEQESDFPAQFDSQERKSDGDDDFADFATFAAAPSSVPETKHDGGNGFTDVNVSQSQNLPERENEGLTENFASFGSSEQSSKEQDNGFADFSEAAFSQTESDFQAFSAPPNDEDDGFDNFADFQTNAKSFEDDDDDFGDFSTSTKTETTAFSAPVAPEPYQHPNANFGNWFSYAKRDCDDFQIFPIHNQMEDDLLNVFSSSDNVSQSDTNPKRPTKYNMPSHIWDAIEDIDNTIALKFLWNQSSHHQHLISSLGIKTQNILFGKASKPYYVPTYYAAGLGMLEPGNEMIKPMSAAEKITAVSPKDKNMPTDGNTKGWSTETAANGVVNGGRACSGVEPSDGVVANGSAISGAIDAGSINLDMLSDTVKSHGSTNSIAEQDKVDPDLLELAMKVTPDPAATKKADPLSKILATLGVASTASKQPDEDEHLSEDAKKVLKRLPELSFMRSKVLMFPVGKSTALHH